MLPLFEVPLHFYGSVHVVRVLELVAADTWKQVGPVLKLSERACMFCGMLKVEALQQADAHRQTPAVWDFKRPKVFVLKSEKPGRGTRMRGQRSRVLGGGVHEKSDCLGLLWCCVVRHDGRSVLHPADGQIVPRKHIVPRVAIGAGRQGLGIQLRATASSDSLQATDNGCVSGSEPVERSADESMPAPKASETAEAKCCASLTLC